MVASLVSTIAADACISAFCQEPAPANDVAVNFPVLELNNKLPADFGGRVPVAAVTKSGKHVSSDDSARTAIFVAVVEEPI